jgi:multidrug transporter EmrE-like cation transporter
MQFILSHFYLLLAISFGVASQLIIKWQMSAFSFNDYETWQDKYVLAFSMLLNPYIILSLILTLLAGVTWMITMTKFEISYAYPFTLLGLVFVTIFSILFLGEDFNLYKVGGIVLILFGVVVISKGL